MKFLICTEFYYLYCSTSKIAIDLFLALFNFKEIYHGLGSYPDILYVQIMLSDGNISDAQGM